MKRIIQRIIHSLWRIIRTTIIIVVVFMGLRYIVWTSLTDYPVCPFCFGSHAIHDYYLLTGIDRRCAVDDPEATVRIYGDPLSISKEFTGSKGSIVNPNRYRVLYNYDGFSIIFFTDDGINYSYLGFVLTSENRWLRWDVHVGSSREQVVQAYRGRIPCTEDGERGNGYFDTRHRSLFETYVQFTYDENDIVTSIRCYLPTYP